MKCIMRKKVKKPNGQSLVSQSSYKEIQKLKFPCRKKNQRIQTWVAENYLPVGMLKVYCSQFE